MEGGTGAAEEDVGLGDAASLCSVATGSQSAPYSIKVTSSARPLEMLPREESLQ